MSGVDEGTMVPLDDAEYRRLAAFRHALRRFLAFSNAAAHAAGLPPRQHQAILAIRGAAAWPPTVGDLAEQLLVAPHTAAELVERLSQAGYVVRQGSEQDRRRVELTLTPKAEDLLRSLSAAHLDELRRIAPLLSGLLGDLEPKPTGSADGTS